MKTVLTLYIISSFAFQQGTSENKFTEKINKIRSRLLHIDSLPPTIIDIKTFLQDSNNHYLRFKTARMEDDLLDSVYIYIRFAVNDSLMNLNFTEDHFKKGKQQLIYQYSVNKYGLLDFAAYTNNLITIPDSIVAALAKNTTGVVALPMSEPVIEIASASRSDSVLKRPSKKRIEMYNNKLEMTINELYQILFE